MSNKTIEMFTIRQILRLYASGKGTKSISQSTGIARNTIKKYLYRYVLSEKTMEQIEKMSDAEMSRLFLIKEPIKVINKRVSDLEQLCKSGNLSLHKIQKMNTQTTASPKLFIGMDIHKKSWSVHFRTDLFDHKGFSMPPEAEKLFDYVELHFAGHEVSLTYEAGCCGFSAARYFLNLGWQVKVVNPSDVPRMDKQFYQKTDKLDSRNLCKQLQQDQLHSIHIPGEAEEQLRSLLRQRIQVVKLLRKSKSHIKSLLLFHGIVVPEEYDNPNWSNDFLEWLKGIKWSNSTGKSCIDSKLRILELLHSEYLHTSNELRAYCRKYHKKDYYLLKSIPGIGGLLSAAILAELGDIRRFNNEREFSNCIGLVPGIHQSSETQSNMGITPRCKSLLRSYLIESSWIAIRYDPEIQAYYRKHVGKNPKNVIVKVAHKMCRRILSVIKNEIPYQISYSSVKTTV